MSKMLRQFSVVGADVYLVTSTLIFITFFIAVGVYVLTMKRKDIEDCEKLPLE